MSTTKKRLFVTDDGKNLVFTFTLVSSLFLLWGFGTGLIDVMDKHFQDELGLTKSQSAWVQFVHYLAYFVIAMPASLLASKFGYKGGIIIGLLTAAVGGIWFLPATYINDLARAGSVSMNMAFAAFLLGVFIIAAGFTFLETIANPYTTVLGPRRYAATRINLAQSCNGVGWIFGPIVGSMCFYAKNDQGHSTGSEMLWIPYAAIAGVVILLSIIFYFANIPDIKAKDEYQLDETGGGAANINRVLKRGWVYVMMFANSATLLFIGGMILWLILDAVVIQGASVGSYCIGLAAKIPNPFSIKLTPSHALLMVLTATGCVLLAIAAISLIPVARKISHHSIWSHPHFSAAILAQFLYVAAQTGIFSFFINYMTEEPPPLPAALQANTDGNADAQNTSSWTQKIGTWLGEWIEVRTRFFKDDIQDLSTLVHQLKEKSDPVSAFLNNALSEETRVLLADYQDSPADEHALRVALAHDLNQLVGQDPKKVKPEQIFYDPQRFQGVQFSEKTQALLATDAQNKNSARLNRLLLVDAYPGVIAYQDGVLGISNAGAAMLLSFGFTCFLVGRFTGAWLLKKFSAHKSLGVYGMVNVVVCFLVFSKLGWISMVCVFLSFFFMSIMYPTIFALGIFGLGARAKMASAYIVMAIMGGAALPKFMGYVADQHDMSFGFIVPVVCFSAVALYGFCWPMLSNAKSMHNESIAGGH